MATLIFSFATYEFSRKFFVFFYFWFAALTTTSLLRLRRGSKESRGGETGGRRKLDSQAGQRASLFRCHKYNPPPISYVTRQSTPPECQEYRPPPERAESNTTTPNPKTKGMGGKYTCVRARACVACLNQTKPKPAFGSAAYKKSSKKPKNSQKFERNKNERYCEWDGKKRSELNLYLVLMTSSRNHSLIIFTFQSL